MGGAVPKIILVSLELLGAFLVIEVCVQLSAPAPGLADGGSTGSSSITSGAGIFPTTSSSASSTPKPIPTPTETSRGPSSIDVQNTYRSGGGGGAAFSERGSAATKEPVIDGKAIPKVIDFSAHSSNAGGEAPKPQPKGKGGKPKRPARKQTEREIDFPAKDDGL